MSKNFIAESTGLYSDGSVLTKSVSRQGDQVRAGIYNAGSYGPTVNVVMSADTVWAHNLETCDDSHLEEGGIYHHLAPFKGKFTRGINYYKIEVDSAHVITLAIGAVVRPMGGGHTAAGPPQMLMKFHETEMVKVVTPLIIPLEEISSDTDWDEFEAMFQEAS